MWIIRKPSRPWYELSGTHLAINMSCREPILLVFREAAVPWIFPCFCCFCHGPDEAHFGQRQQTCLGKLVFAASVKDPMKLTLIKGSKHAFGSRFLLPPPRIQRNSLCQRQQTWLRKQVFAASASNPKKLTLVKGSKQALGSRFLLPPPRIQWSSLWSKAANMSLEAGFCCLRQGSNETHFGQRQQTCLWKQGFAASAENPMKSQMKSTQ